MITINAKMAPADWPEEMANDDMAIPRPDERPHAFAILFGAHVIRVAGDGALTIVSLPAAIVFYLRTGRPSLTGRRAHCSSS